MLLERAASAENSQLAENRRIADAASAARLAQKVVWQFGTRSVVGSLQGGEDTGLFVDKIQTFLPLISLVLPVALEAEEGL